MKRLTCEQAFQRLDDYVDRELTAQKQEEVARHLAVCAACAPEFALEREILDDLRAKVRRIRIPAGLRARISAALRSA